MNEKVISNTFTVNTVVDGISQQQIFTRNANAALPPRSQSDNPTLPSGWTYTPQGVDNTHPDEYVSMRSKDSSGVWSDYSPKVPYSHYGEDGTSIRIKGVAIEIGQGTLPDALEPYEEDLSLTSLGDIILFDEAEDPTFGPAIIKRVKPYVEDEETKHFVVESVTVGDGYLIASKSGQAADEGHLYVATEFDDSGDSSGNYYFWQDCGRIKGEKGDDGVMYVLEPSIPQFNTNQGRTKTQTCIIRAYKIEGKTKSAFTGCFEILSVVPDGQIQPDSTYQSGNNASFGTNKTSNATSYVVRLWDKDPRELYIDEPAPALLASINIPIAFDGAQGVQGKIGRFFYFGGEFNAADTTQTFIVNDAQAPYFEHSETITTQSGTTIVKRYHVFNYDTNGTYTMAQMWAIRNNWNSKPWEAMTNDFKYIITQALFADFAKLGSWVFSGDYMLSQTGVDGTTNYQNFTGESGAWQPNLYMNALTGRLVGNNVNLRGVFRSYDAVYWNGIEMNAQEGYFKMTGPDVVGYGGKPSSGASIVDLFKIEFRDKESVVVEGETTVRCIRMTIGDEDLNHIRIDSNDYFDGAVIRLGNSSKGAAVGTNLDDGNIPKMRFWDNYYNQSGEQRSMELDANGVRFKGGDGNYGNVRLTNEGVEVYRPNGTLWASKSWGRIIGFE